MIDEAVIARVRAHVSSAADPGTLLTLYSDPSRRPLLRARVQAAAGVPLDDPAADRLCAELFGLGPLQPLLEDPEITDVLVNGPDQIFVERLGVLERSTARFRDASELGEIVYRVAASVGRELTIEHPYVDARMRDGSRANAVIEPVGGPTLSIRKFRPVSIPLDGDPRSWVASGALHATAACYLSDAVVGRANVLVSGATGSGKSTLLRSLAAVIPSAERLVVIEDTNELVLPHPHVVHLECVPGREQSVTVADLVVNALRMRPDRIIVGEVRSPREASALLEALSTGHDGALTTLHAGSAEDAIARLELLLARAGELAPTAIERHIRRSIDVVVHLSRDRFGSRRVREIAARSGDDLKIIWHHGDSAISGDARWR